jgi:KEOPS complex subunit Pcc1
VAGRPDDTDHDHDHEATLTFTYATSDRAGRVAASLRVEVDAVADDRSRTTVDRRGRTVRLRVTAADPVALRAGCTSWTRLVATAERVAGPDAERV